MSNLKFIEKEIEDLKSLLELDDVLCEITDNDYKYYTEQLQTLQQIKTILEAWEIVKQDFIVTWENPDIANGYYLKYFGDTEYETIKKALEVKEDE